MDAEGTRRETLPDRLDEWVDRRAAELGTDRAGVLARAVVALRAIEDEADAALGNAAAVDPRRVEARVSDLEDAVDAKVDDVRDRVVQVKRETDAKAEADHDHPDLREATSEARAAAAEAADRAAAAADAAAAVDDRATAGFENFEEVVSCLRDGTDATADRLDAAARTLVDLRGRVAALEREAHRRETAVAIRAEANRRGAAAARCGACGAAVSLSLLDRAVCPDCGAAFDGLGPERSFLRKAELTVGDGEPPRGDGAVADAGGDGRDATGTCDPGATGGNRNADAADGSAPVADADSLPGAGTASGPAETPTDPFESGGAEEVEDGR